MTCSTIALLSCLTLADLQPSTPPRWHDGVFSFSIALGQGSYAIDRSADLVTWVEWQRCQGGTVVVIDCNAFARFGFYRVRVL